MGSKTQATLSPDKFSKLIYKNAIKFKIGDPPCNFVQKALIPRDLGKKLSYSPRLDFQPYAAKLGQLDSDCWL